MPDDTDPGPRNPIPAPDVTTVDTAGQAPELPDDGHRYLLTVPRGYSTLLDAVSPHADHHTIAAYGSADLARRLDDANHASICVAWRQLDPTDDTDGM